MPATVSGTPNTPSVVNQLWSIVISAVRPRWYRKPNSHCPASAYTRKTIATIGSDAPIVRRVASSTSSIPTVPTAMSIAVSGWAVGKRFTM